MVHDDGWLKLLAPLTPVEKSFLAQNDIVQVNDLKMLSKRPETVTQLMETFGKVTGENGVNPGFAKTKFLCKLDEIFSELDGLPAGWSKGCATEGGKVCCVNTATNESVSTHPALVDEQSRDNAALQTKPRTKQVAKKAVLKTPVSQSSTFGSGIKEGRGWRETKIHDDFVSTTMKLSTKISMAFPSTVTPPTTIQNVATETADTRTAAPSLKTTVTLKAPTPKTHKAPTPKTPVILKAPTPKTSRFASAAPRTTMTTDSRTLTPDRKTHVTFTPKTMRKSLLQKSIAKSIARGACSKKTKLLRKKIMDAKQGRGNHESCPTRESCHTRETVVLLMCMQHHTRAQHA